MNGKLLAMFLAASALVVGAGLYYSLEYAYYQPVAPDSPAAKVRLTSLATGQPEVIPTADFQGIDADTSPLRYRACFTLPTSVPTLTATYRVYDTPVPLIAPRHFSCFDAAAIGDALDSGVAVAFLGLAKTQYGIDRVIAVLPDGRAYAWNQMNRCGEMVFAGEAVPKGCPPPPSDISASTSSRLRLPETN